MKSVRLCVIRHGQTPWNEDRRFQGWTDIPLDDIGRSQARALRGTLGSRFFDFVWSSDLQRAVETARIVAGEPKIDRRLREMDFGSLEGLIWADMDPSLRSTLDGFDEFSAPSGESTADLRERVFGFLGGLEPGSHLIVSHGGVIRMLRRACGGEGFPGHGDVTEIDWTRRAIVSYP